MAQPLHYWSVGQTMAAWWLSRQKWMFLKIYLIRKKKGEGSEQVPKVGVTLRSHCKVSFSMTYRIWEHLPSWNLMRSLHNSQDLAIPRKIMQDLARPHKTSWDLHYCPVEPSIPATLSTGLVDMCFCMPASIVYIWTEPQDLFTRSSSLWNLVRSAVL